MNIETFYNTIADEFDKTRVRLWTCVKNYLDTFEKNSYILYLIKKLIFILFILLINA